jgi:hypothetical protein
MNGLNQPMRMGPYGLEEILSYEGFFVSFSVVE